jgi:hypothetical protein
MNRYLRRNGNVLAASLSAMLVVLLPLARADVLPAGFEVGDGVAGDSSVNGTAGCIDGVAHATESGVADVGEITIKN